MQLNKKMKIIVISISVTVFVVAGGFIALQRLNTSSGEQTKKLMAENHDQHDHDEHAAHDEKHDDETEDLFSEEGHADHDENKDEHAGHDHATENSTEADEHAGHGHANSPDGICPEHRVLESEDALCQGGHLSELQPGEGMKVRLTSADVAAKAGIKIVKPQTISLADGIDLPGRVKFNRNKLAYITPLSSGVMLKVNVQPGSKVNKGDILAEIAMPEIASLKGQLLAASAHQNQTEATYQREKNLMERGISSTLEFQKAEAEFRAAQSVSQQYHQQLQNYGLDPATIEQLLIDGKSSAALFLRAPLSGTVVMVETAVGEAVEPGTPLFTLADLDSLWLEISVPESRIYQIRDNAKIQASFNGLPDMVFPGQIFQSGTIVDERTRTLKVLAEVRNSEQRLKVGMFGNVRILEGAEEQVLTVSANTLQNIDGESYVFVQQESDLFDLRRVQVGTKTDDRVVILAGLSMDDQVVSSQGFSLKSEVLKARLGASCADH
jgi:cobalt-zinc-cadmium efflux system membrane fusion protein